MGCLSHTRCPACGALLMRNFPGLIPSLMASRFLWDFCKIPRNRHFSSFLGWRRPSPPARRSPISILFFSISGDFDQFYY